MRTARMSDAAKHTYHHDSNFDCVSAPRPVCMPYVAENRMFPNLKLEASIVLMITKWFHDPTVCWDVATPSLLLIYPRIRGLPLERFPCCGR